MDRYRKFISLVTNFENEYRYAPSFAEIINYALEGSNEVMFHFIVDHPMFVSKYLESIKRISE